MSALPASLNVGVFGAVSALVTMLLSAFAPLLLQVPGLRAQDGSRSILMRSLVFLLNLGGVVAYSFVSGVVVPKGSLISLLVDVAGAAGFGHVLYLASSAAHSAASSSSTVSADPSAALDALVSAAQQASAPAAPTATSAAGA